SLQWLAIFDAERDTRYIDTYLALPCGNALASRTGTNTIHGSQMARRGTVEARERKPSRAKQAYAAPEFISRQCLPLLVPGTHRSHLTDRYSVSVQSADQRDIWGIVIDKAWRHPQSMVPLLDAEPIVLQQSKALTGQSPSKVAVPFPGGLVAIRQ
ncbi:hypothetical protein CMEL01_11451, partial [Colletotrichum melonis]